MVPKRNQPILSDEEITNIVIKYLDEDIYDYAVMIDGDWGCGKTFFVKETLIDHITRHEEAKGKDARNVLYISLYGVKSVDEISKQIIVESFVQKTGKEKGKFPARSKIIGTLLSVPSVLGMEIDAERSLGKLVELLPLQKSILIFDDLERCDCPVNEILGYLNTFVEQEGVKIIIIANEKEIGHSTYQMNRELKYLVAAHSGIEFDVDSTDKKKYKETLAFYKIPEKQQQHLAPIDVATLQKRSEVLFGENEVYERVKEKLIGNVIHYHPDLKKCLKAL